MRISDFIAQILGIISVVVLKWPAMIIIPIIITIELLIYFTFRAIIYFFESFRIYRSHRKLRRKVRFGEGLNTYKTWSEAAKLLDFYDGRDKWKMKAEDPIYNHTIIQKLVLDLHITRTKMQNLLDQRELLLKQNPALIGYTNYHHNSGSVGSNMGYNDPTISGIAAAAEMMAATSSTTTTGDQYETTPVLQSNINTDKNITTMNPIDINQTMVEPTQSLFDPSQSIYDPQTTQSMLSLHPSTYGPGQSIPYVDDKGIFIKGKGGGGEDSTINISGAVPSSTPSINNNNQIDFQNLNTSYQNFPIPDPALSIGGLSSATKTTSITFPNYSNNTNYISTTIPLAPIEPSTVFFPLQQPPHIQHQPSQSRYIIPSNDRTPSPSPHSTTTTTPPPNIHQLQQNLSPSTPQTKPSIRTNTTTSPLTPGSHIQTSRKTHYSPKIDHIDQDMSDNDDDDDFNYFDRKDTDSLNKIDQYHDDDDHDTFDNIDVGLTPMITPTGTSTKGISTVTATTTHPKSTTYPSTASKTLFSTPSVLHTTRHSDNNRNHPTSTLSAATIPFVQQQRQQQQQQNHQHRQQQQQPQQQSPDDITIADIVAGVIEGDYDHNSRYNHDISTTDEETSSSSYYDRHDDDLDKNRKNMGYNNNNDNHDHHRNHSSNIPTRHRHRHHHTKDKNGGNHSVAVGIGPAAAFDAFERASQATLNTAGQFVDWFQKTAGPVVRRYTRRGIGGTGENGDDQDDSDNETTPEDNDGDDDQCRLISRDDGQADGTIDGTGKNKTNSTTSSTRLSRTTSALEQMSPRTSSPVPNSSGTLNPNNAENHHSINVGDLYYPNRMNNNTSNNKNTSNNNDQSQNTIIDPNDSGSISQANNNPSHRHHSLHHSTPSHNRGLQKYHHEDHHHHREDSALQQSDQSISIYDAHQQLLLLDQQMNSLLFNLIHLIQLALRQQIALLNEELYSYTNVGTKYLITSFTNEIVEALSILSQTPQPPEKRLELFLSLSKLYGHNALCLSGGAGFCGYHWGLCKALVENQMLSTIKCFSGTSAGSMVAAHICTRTDDELLHGFLPDVLSENMKFDNGQGTFDKLKSFYQNGYLIDSGKWTELLQYHCCGDMTFLEAYQKTGRVLVITATPAGKNEPPIFLSYLTSPHCVIRTACVASATIPYLLPPSSLLFKDPYTGAITPDTTVYSGLRDGSFVADIPNVELAYYFNTSFHLVSQVNPHISLFYFNRNGSSGRSSTHWGWSEFRGTFILSLIESWLKYDMVKNLQIMKEMRLFPSFWKMGDVSNIFLQNFSGPTHNSICVVPDTSFQDYLNLLSAPTPADVTRMIKGGEMMLYFKKSLIDSRLSISSQILLGIQQAEIAMGKLFKPTAGGGGSPSTLPASSPPLSSSLLLHSADTAKTLLPTSAISTSKSTPKTPMVTPMGGLIDDDDDDSDDCIPNMNQNN